MATLPGSASSEGAPGTQQTSATEINSRTPTFVEPDARSVDSGDVNSEFEHEAYGPGPGEKAVDSFEIIMSPDDPENPKMWKRSHRWFITVLAASLCLNAYVFLSFSFGSLRRSSRVVYGSSVHLRRQRLQASRSS